MRVFTVYFEHRPGGMMKMIYRMLLAGAERGWQMSYLAVSPYRVEHENLRPHLLPAPRNHSSILFWAWFLALAPFATLWLAWRQRSELLAMFEGVYACLALPAKKILGLPMVVFLQSDVATINAMHGRASLLRRIEQWMEGAGLRNADRIIATNETLADLVRRRWNLPPQRVLVLPNNVGQPPRTSDEARVRLRRDLGLADDAFLIVTSGVFSPRKNLPLLLAAFARVGSPRAHLVVIGEGTEPARWRTLVDETRAAANGERVHFLGWRSDVVDVLAGCDLFIFPTRHEGSPLSLIEALRVGLPCLGSDIEEIREVLGDEPRALFGVDAVEVLAARLESAATDADVLERLRLHAETRARIYDFDWDAEVAAILAAQHRARTPLLVRIYEAATGMRATPRSSAAVGRFGPYVAGMIAAKGLSTAGQILISRLLGPSEVGRLAVVISTSTIVALPLAGAWGSAYVRYAAGQAEALRLPLLRWVARRALGSTAIVAAIVALATPLIAPALDVPSYLLAAGAGLGAAMAMWLLAKAASQGSEDWRRFVASEFGFGAATLIVPLVLLAFGALTWWEGGLAILVGYGLGSLPALPRLARSHASPAVPAQRFAKAAAYGKFALLTGTANALFLYGDRLAAQSILGFTEVGIYHVYNFATLGVAALLSTMVQNFLFPLLPQGDHRAFASLFRSSFARLLPLILVTLFAAGWIQIALSGFPFRLGLLVLATMSSASFMISGFYGQLVLSLGVHGSQLASRVAAATLTAFVLGVVPAVRLAGLGGLFGLYTLIYASVAAYYSYALTRLEAEPHEAKVAASS